MKKIMPMLLLILSFSSFAETFTVVERGTVTWVQHKDELIVPISLYAREVSPGTLSPEKLIEVETSMARVPFGYRGEYIMTLPEGTQALEQTKLLVERKMEELMFLPVKYSLSVISNEFTDQTCRTKGIFKRRKVCSAVFEIKMDIKLID